MKTSASIEPRLSTASGSGSDEEDVGGPLVVITSKNRQTLTHDHCAADDNGYSTDKEPATDESLGSKPEENDIAPPPTPILCPESSSGTALESPDRAWDRAVAEAKGQAVARLEEQLRSAQAELRLRDEEVSRLTKIRERIEAELEELTASLFQEAHNMVRDANVRQAAAERSLKESQMQVEVLSAEVSALKTLVLTSTPSRPNPHLHPQIDPSVASVNGGGLFARKHRRSPSHFNLKYGRENSPPDSPVKEPPYGSNATSSAAAAAAAAAAVVDFNDSKDGWEVDPIVHREFVAWRQHPRLDRTEPFIARVYAEEIELCLTFANSTLGEQVRNAIEEGTIAVEAVTDKTRTLFPKKCALLEAPRQCHYRMKVADSDQWHFISKICRNRIISVCEFLNYLRYIERGLVKSSVHDNYWEMTRLRKEMVLARLGLSISSS